MTQKWEISEPKLLDVGGEGERVGVLSVALIAGHVDVVTHEDSGAASVEVQEVVGPPLEVTWDGHRLEISHVKTSGSNMWEALKGLGAVAKNVRARVSISIPNDAKTSINTVSAGAVVSGIHADTSLNTVSGDVAADDIQGRIETNGVSGTFEGRNLRGRLEANTVSGAMTVHHSALDPIELNGVSGDITLDLTDFRTHVESNTVSGDVTVRVPQGGGYFVKVSTMSGAAIVDGMKLGGKWHRGGEARDGDEALRINANSMSGDVVVLRAAGPDLSKS
ncbi:DUF4097 family beta strand repeat-containing protein [Flexivirga caeni]|nr:DUF4097 family beta strand repeat-containing protein [Flexivirga caeni]